MNYLKPILIISLYLLISCGSDTESQPEHILNEAEMTGVLIDIHLTESALSIKNYTRDTSLMLYDFYKEEVFKKHNITEQQFKDSYEYYSKHSVEIDKIYAAVVDSLAMRESKAPVRK